MSRYSETHHVLLNLTTEVHYEDDMGLTRTKYLVVRVGSAEITVCLTWLARYLLKPKHWKSLRYAFILRHFPFTPVDSEQMYYDWLDRKRGRK